jgi:hypothetical protein
LRARAHTHMPHTHRHTFLLFSLLRLQRQHRITVCIMLCSISLSS